MEHSARFKCKAPYVEIVAKVVYVSEVAERRNVGELITKASPHDTVGI